MTQTKPPSRKHKTSTTPILFAYILGTFFLLGALEIGARAYLWGKYDVNDGGFRNREGVFTPKTQGAIRIISYGGETTLCTNLDLEDSWPRLLERKLRHSRIGGAQDQILNGGLRGGSISHLLERAKTELPKYRADYVTLYTGIHETKNARGLTRQYPNIVARLESGESGLYYQKPPVIAWIQGSFALSRLFKGYQPYPAINGERKMKNAISVELILSHYKRSLKQFIDLIHVNGATPVFVTQISDGMPVNVAYTLFSKEGTLVAKELGAIVIDPSPILENRDTEEIFSDTGIHLSQKGSRLFADYLYEQLLPQIEPSRDVSINFPESRRTPTAIN